LGEFKFVKLFYFIMPKLRKEIRRKRAPYQFELKRTILKVGDYYTSEVVSYSNGDTLLCIPLGPYIIVKDCGELKPDIGQKIICRITSIGENHYKAKFVCCTV